jgi:trans-aconitate methyltransferase
VLPQLLEAYRSGDGVPYARLWAADAAWHRRAQPADVHAELASTWLPAVPEVDRQLRSAPPARVLDLSCGLGASSVALACAYPRAHILGVDLDQASVTEACAPPAEAGMTDRVRLVVGDAARVTAEAPLDLVTTFETLHDMGDPVGTLRAVRALLGDEGQRPGRRRTGG